MRSPCPVRRRQRWLLEIHAGRTRSSVTRRAPRGVGKSLTEKVDHCRYLWRALATAGVMQRMQRNCSSVVLIDEERLQSTLGDLWPHQEVGKSHDAKSLQREIEQCLAVACRDVAGDVDRPSSLARPERPSTQSRKAADRQAVVLEKVLRTSRCAMPRNVGRRSTDDALDIADLARDRGSVLKRSQSDGHVDASLQ